MKLKEFAAFVENKFERKIKILRSDNGGEYTSNAFKSYCTANGIQQQFTVPYTPQQNGVAERMNRTLVESVISMLACCDAPKQFWGEALMTAAYVRNYCITSGYGNRIPFELWNGIRANISHLRVFGSNCVVWIPKEKRDGKLAHDSMQRKFLGYDANRKSYRCWNSTTKSVLVSRDVTFDESNIAFNEKHDASELTSSNDLGFFHSSSVVIHSNANVESNEIHNSSGRIEVVDENAESSGSNDASEDNSDDGILDSIDFDSDPINDEYEDSNIHDNFDDSDLNSSDADEAFADANEMIDDAAQYEFVDERQNSFNDHDQHSSEQLVDTALRRSTRNRKPLQKFWESSNAAIQSDDEDSHELTVAEDEVDLEPATYAEAIDSEESVHWKDAASEEMDSLYKHETWDLVDLPVNRKAIGRRWVFKRKIKPDRSIERYKARLVAKGYSQVKGIDFEETYAPVAQMKSIRTIIAIATELDLELQHMDVKTAFLNGDLEEEIYMLQPEGFVVPGMENKVCKLKKALYGLKQAPRAWNQKLDTFLKNNCFKQSQEDTAIYIKGDGLDIFIIAVYVDDLILSCRSMDSINEMKQELSSQSEMKDLGELEYCLGVQIQRDRKKRNYNAFTVKVP